MSDDRQSTPESVLITKFKERLEQIGLIPHGPFRETWYLEEAGKQRWWVDIGYVYREIKVRVYLNGELSETHDLLREDPAEVIGLIDVQKHLLQMAMAEPS